MKYYHLPKGSYRCFCLSDQSRFWCNFSKTTAIDKGNHYLLNGTKTGLQTDSASTYIVIAQTDIEKDTKESMLYSWKGWAGFDGPKEKKMEFVDLIHIH
jgi:alkylation response protein AidB-like acyl-CoA dehydrogenase